MSEFIGPLRVHPYNPRFFTDDGKRAIYLAGSHTWESLQDFIREGKGPFDYGYYLDVMQRKNHNFMRMWMWEQAAWMPGTEDKIVIDPLPYARTGSGLALDGGLKFDLTRWNDAFFARLRGRVLQACERGIYVSVMLYEGFSVKKPWLAGDPWLGHPFHRDNNVNGIDGDCNGDGMADIHSLEIPSVVRLQEAFVRKVVDTVNDLDNVLYEIINEGSDEPRTLAWENHLTDFIHQYEITLPKQHPVGITPTGNRSEKTALFEGPADWISPNYIMDERYKADPPAADGRKIILNDTDHVMDQPTVEYKWAWKCLLRGQHPVFMDPWDTDEFCDQPVKTPESLRRLDLIRSSMGHSLRYAERMDLAAMAPSGGLSSTGYCLANPGKEYLVYLPDGGMAEVDLGHEMHRYSVEWFDALKGEAASAPDVNGCGSTRFVSPFCNDAVLYLYRTE